MVTLAIVAALTALTVLLVDISARRMVIAAAAGLLVGAVLDFTAGYHLGLWHYTHHPYWTPDYFYLLYPAWALAGVMLVALHDWVRTWSADAVVALLLSSLMAMTIHESIGFIRDAWRYDAPVWLVLVGWPLYIWFLTLSVDKVQHALSSTKARRTV